ncbi:alpha/beta hydrolase [Niabella hibiscisoli]|uniref:alpha/beta hydrolase n=1 Tax=Niabella hibiscisoli TaxID=1825928 RepID=UPI001F1162E3|nr:alpha/beta fold hydrolase [Niabella hibiscisoli]MCH5721217.1 alpha/beta hydrolase [Niabella hibiscisoli]
MSVQSIIIKIFRGRLQLLATLSKKRAGNEAFRIFCTPYFRMAYKESEVKGSERLSFKFGSANTIGYRWNRGDRKKLLIVHGFRSASANFLHFTAPLIQKGYEIVAFDAPAHGLSEGKRLNAIEYKDFITALHDHYGPFGAFLAHSFGGLAVSMNLAELSENTNIKTVLVAPAANSRQLIEFFLKKCVSGMRRYVTTFTPIFIASAVKILNGSPLQGVLMLSMVLFSGYTIQVILLLL